MITITATENEEAITGEKAGEVIRLFTQAKMGVKLIEDIILNTGDADLINYYSTVLVMLVGELSLTLKEKGY